MTCRQCPNGSDGEWYRFLVFEWDVKKARKFVAQSAHKQGVVALETLKKYGLPIEKQVEKVDEQGRKYFTVSLFGINEEHLSHIPEEKLYEPILVAPLLMKGIRSTIIIDGSHRAVRLAREDKPVIGVSLSDAESLACLNIGEHDRKHFKVFPRIKPAKLNERAA